MSSVTRADDFMVEGRRNYVTALALAVSLAMHILFYTSVGNRAVKLFDSGIAEEPPKRDYRTVRVGAHAETAPTLADPLRSGGGGVGQGADSATMIDRLTQPTAASIFEPPPASMDMNAAALSEKLVPNVADTLPKWQPRQEIMQVLDATARDFRAPLPRRTIPKIERQSLAPDITASYNLVEGLTKAAGGITMPAPAAAGLQFSEPVVLQGGDASVPVIHAGKGAAVASPTRVVAEIPAAVAPAYPIEDRLQIAVTSTLGLRDGYRYFTIDVSPRDAQSLPAMPRDIVFVQDTSASLGERYLTPCRLALAEAVEGLPQGDRFNIINFSDSAARCFEEWSAPTIAAKMVADSFIKQMRSWGNTDLFASMEHVLALPSSDGRARMAVVITDGNVTVGELERDSQIIGTFTRLNGGQASVFTVATHPRSNTYLLDMLSYANRGARTFVAPDRFNVKKTIIEAIKSIENPLLANVRFNFDSTASAEVYPTLTTNLYAERPLRLFGRVRADQKSVVFQVRGDAVERKCDMLFEIDFQGQEIQRGAADLGQQWAIQAMYDLVAQYARTENASLKADMQALGAIYGIPVPYKTRIITP